MSRCKTEIAILGATSHIAKGLISRLIREPSFNLHLFTRSADRVLRFLESEVQEKAPQYGIVEGYDDFADHSFDVVINCIGVGTEKKLKGEYVRYFTVTEEFDNLVLKYLSSCSPETLYIAFSSGAVYGRGFSAPVSDETINSIRVNHVVPQDYYGIVRLYAETKHRAFKQLKIVDIRIFSYFSRHIDVSEGYFIADVMECILNNKVLETSDVNIVRDYIHPDDLYALILRCMDAGRINTAFDVASTKPVEKIEILDYFAKTYGLKYVTRASLGCFSPTGSKNIYFPERHKVDRIGFSPRYSSMETIMQEAEYILKPCHR